MSSRSRFSKLQIQLSNVNQKEISMEIDEDQSLNDETKNLLKNIVECSISKKNSIQHETSTVESSPIIKSPMKYRRGKSLILLQNLDIMRVQQAENEGFHKKSLFSTEKQHEEKKCLLSQSIAPKERIDMKDINIQNLAVEIAVKAIKTQAESQFMIKMFIENSLFKKWYIPQSRIKKLTYNFQYKFYPKNSVIYETGDFGQNYYFLLSGELYQLLPTNQEIASSPLKITNCQGSQIKPKLRFINCANQEDITQKHQQKDQLKKQPLKNLSLNTSHLNQQFQIDQEYQLFVPFHKFNQFILPGTGFGDSELLSRQRRGCTIYCQQDSHVISINKEQFDQLIGEEKLLFVQEKILFFSQFEFLKDIPNPRLIQIIDTSVTIHLNSKNILYSEGSDCGSIYFIRKGEIHLTTILSNDVNTVENNNNQQIGEELNLHMAINKRKKQQERVPISILSENSYFGEYEILKKIKQRVTQAICSSQECEIIEVKSQTLLKLLKEFGKVSNFKKNESIRDEFMRERLELMQNQKQEHVWNRLVQEHKQVSPQIITNPEYGSRQRISSLQVFSTSTNSKSQNTQQPIIFKNNQFSIRNKSSTQSLDSDNQGGTPKNPYINEQTNQKFFIKPNKLEDFNKNCHSPFKNLSFNLEKSISFSPSQLVSRMSRQSSKHQQSPQNLQKFFQTSYDFSIKESKNQIKQEIQKTEESQEQPQSQYKRQSFILNKFKSISQSRDSLTSIDKGYIYNKNNNEDVTTIIKNEFQKNLFQTFLDDTEKKVLKKQEIILKLSNNNQIQQTQNDPCKPMFFEDEFQKGFNSMYMRKFGKKYQKK